MHILIRAWSVFCAFLPLQLARWHWLKVLFDGRAAVCLLLQLARWHWLKGRSAAHVVPPAQVATRTLALVEGAF